MQEPTLEVLIARVVAQTGCNPAVAQASLADTGYRLESAIQLARAKTFEKEVFISFVGRMTGRCPVCQRQGKLTNVVVNLPASCSIGAACFKCLKRLHDNVDLIAAFPIGTQS